MDKLKEIDLLIEINKIDQEINRLEIKKLELEIELNKMKRDDITGSFCPVLTII
jgi:predicted  nucleic acid-binding Zn-ribbon protein